MFFAACEGYFDKEEEAALVQRKLAQVLWGSNAGKPGDFEKFWPLPEKFKQEPVIKTWGTAEEAQQMREEIMKAHKIKL